MNSHRTILAMLASSALALVQAVGCGTSHPQSGSETNWLLSCTDDADCGDASCVCSVCTVACEGGDGCGTAPTGYACNTGQLMGQLCEGSHTVGLCLPECSDEGDCEGDQSCMAGSCVPAAVVSAISAASASSMPAASSPAVDAGFQRPGPLSPVAMDTSLPSVMLVMDTSGSLERLPDCVCEDAACLTCVDGRDSIPDCSLAGPEELVKNRWAVALEALTGTFEGFGCEALERTQANGATYDVGFPLDYHRPTYEAQAQDGILDLYADRVRFGVGTFDGLDTYVGAPPLVPVDEFEPGTSTSVDGLWSIGSMVAGQPRPRPDGSLAGLFFYPNCTTAYFMDTGLRSDEALEGRLVLPSDRQTAEDVQASLLSVRPFGGTPIASALDDLHYVYANAAEPGGVSERYAILLSDGYPDDDYRDYGCDCWQNDDALAPGYCGGPVGDCADPASCDNHPANMRCPYPVPEETARLLIEGYPGQPPVLSRLYVVAMSIVGSSEEGAVLLERLNAIADEGGTGSARRASTVVELRMALEEILDDIGVR